MSESLPFVKIENTCAVDVDECECVVFVLLKTKRFSELEYEEKYNIIKEGRPVPILNLTTKVKAFTRHFNENIYEQNEWLTGCKNIGKLFCWPCILFNINDTSIFVSGGFCDLNNLHRNVKRHAVSKSHLEAVFKEKTFGLIKGRSLDSQVTLSHTQHNELVNKNRGILKRLISVTCYLAEHELSFRGDNEGQDLSNRGNYMELLHFLAKYDETLNHHLDQSSTVFRASSNLIQNDLINCLGYVILETIKKEIKDVSFISIILDETNLCQLSVIVRYVKNDATVQERFFGFLDINTEDRTAEAMCKIVCSIVENNFNGDTKLVALSYDGAAVTARDLRGVQDKVKETFNTAIFVHCFAHKLNSMLSQSVGSINECKVFFLTLRGLAAFFTKSTKRTDAFNAIVRKEFPEVCSTPWNYNGRLLGTVYEYRESLLLLFEIILNNKSDWDPETTNGARGYLDLLKNDFDFNFLLNVFYDIIPYTDDLYDVLQTKSNDIDFCVTKIEDFEQNLLRLRDKFGLFWNRTRNENSQNAKCIRIDDVSELASYRLLFTEIIDNMVQQIRDRFKNLSDLKFVELCNFNQYSDSAFPEEALHSLELNYSTLFDIQALRSQLSVLYATPETSTKNLHGMLQFLKETGLDKGYSEVTRLCELVLTIPITSASMERGCSVLKRIKNFMRNSTGETVLSNVAILSIEKDLVKNLSQNPKFLEDVIDEFSKENKTIELYYK